MRFPCASAGVPEPHGSVVQGDDPVVPHPLHAARRARNARVGLAGAAEEGRAQDNRPGES